MYVLTFYDSTRKMSFCIFVFSKQIQLFWKNSRKLMNKVDIYAQKIKCFIFVETNIQVVNLDKFYQGCTQIDIVHCFMSCSSHFSLCHALLQFLITISCPVLILFHVLLPSLLTFSGPAPISSHCLMSCSYLSSLFQCSMPWSHLFS